MNSRATTLICLFVLLPLITAEERSRIKRSFLSSHVLTKSQIEIIVNEHNEIRRNVQPSASNMLRVSWSENLAEKAMDHSKQCSFVPVSESGIGESIEFYSSSDVDSVIKSFVGDWSKEAEFYDFTSSTCASGKQCHHYTQLVSADTYELGCGISYCSAVGLLGEGHIVICKYRDAGKAGIAPYKQGKPCSECGDEFVCSDNFCSKAQQPDLDKQDECYQQNKEMIDKWNEQMKIYEEVHLERWKNMMDDYESTLNGEL